MGKYMVTTVFFTTVNPFTVASLPVKNWPMAREIYFVYSLEEGAVKGQKRNVALLTRQKG